MFKKIWHAAVFTTQALRSMSTQSMVQLSGVFLVTLINIGANVSLTLFFAESLPSLSITALDPLTLITIASGLTLVISLEPFIQALQNKWLIPARVHLSAFIANKITHKVFDLSLDYAYSNPAGALSQLMSQAYYSIDKIVPSLYGKILPVSLEIVILSGTALYFCGPIALALPSAFAIYVGTALLGAYRIDQYQEDHFLKSYTFYGHFHNLFSHYENVHYFGNRDREISRFNRVVGDFGQTVAAALQSIENYSLLQTLVMGITLSTLIIVLGNDLLIEKTLPMATLPFIGLYLYRLPILFNKLPTAVADLQTAAVNIEKVRDFLNQTSEIVELDPAAPLFVPQHAATIEFKQVSFCYQDTVILDDVSFFVPAGTLCAIVGASGVGKSSLLKLLLRFVEVNQGTILINNQDIRHVSLKSLRHAFAIVPQTPILENVSVEQNVRYGNFRASKREVLGAMHLAGLDDLDPQKLCGEGGNKLSGGQKQRVAIARALIRNQSTLLFYDEATSGLDPALEREIQLKLDEISHGRTTLMVTHRLHTVVNADQIIYLENGRIAEQGNYQELMAQPAGRFKQQMLAQCASLGIHIDQIRPQPRTKQTAFFSTRADSTSASTASTQETIYRSTYFFTPNASVELAANETPSTLYAWLTDSSHIHPTQDTEYSPEEDNLSTSSRALWLLIARYKLYVRVKISLKRSHGRTAP